MGTESAVQEILKKYPDGGRDSLIPILQDIQDADGFLSKQAVIETGKYLDLPASQIYGVATFYNQFRFKPIGKNHIMICRGTACHVKGSAEVLNVFERELDIKAGETTRDGEFSIEVVACIGACGLAPVISINGEFHANVSPDSIKKIVTSYKKQK